ncbi:type IV toxin-antitoxin system AbiEi family antitoxin [Paractinoplanes hotanensis]|uniref:Type IV toxin-antitoxin system AbiEi family antitoxin n=1 Tax=Paractinoplanes hotanensis TaxID=2906497 RepID=A0ABT0Y4B5_9ACTN|nr:type IV toxin-antitoxin system AbiEi family antitoxin [Actinoplanes hotanensis]MCM4080861.1 type IV toxin-antitoxin system AbiEi family antitoxin [Actinoplanes hotanensis]
MEEPNGDEVLDNVTRHFLDSARDRLREFGIALEVEPQVPDVGIDAIVTLSRGGQRQLYGAMVKEPMTFSSLAHGARGPVLVTPHEPLILGHRISRRSADAFRDAGIQFVDSLGNAFVTFGNIFVEVQGRAETTLRPINDAHTVRRHQPANIFSSRRSQVIMALLTWPKLSTAKVREIATAAGVSTGQAHDALTQLQDARFLVAESKRLVQIDKLLDLWAAAYPAGLGQTLEIASYHGDPSRPINGLLPGQKFYLSSESAQGSGIVRPMTLTVYLDHMEPKFPVRNRWNADPGRPANIFVRRKFWTSPYADGEAASADGHNAPWPLVYADLIATRDARLNEVAKDWRARFARPDKV